jgi:hypothetical protein
LHLGGTKDVSELLGVLTEYGPGIVTLDMMQTVIDMTPDGHTAFKAGLRREMLGGENTDDWLEKYGELLVPPAFHRMIQFMEMTQHEDQGPASNGPLGTA